MENSDLNELTAISPLDGRYREKVQELANYFSEFALIKTRLELETKYLVTLSENTDLVRKLTGKEKQTLLNLSHNLTFKQAERVKEIEKTTRHDVKAMERAFREFLAGTSLQDVTEMIHFALTSEDINNLAHRLMISRAIKDVMLPAIGKAIDHLVKKAEENKGVIMLARTHGQPAVPTTLGKELVVFAKRLNEETRKLVKIGLTGKLSGAAGNFNAQALSAPEVNWITFSIKFVKNLGFKPNLSTTQINPYEDIIEIFQTFQRINGIILNLDQDIWRYISDNWFTQKAKKDEVGSSTMPQKVNPIDFENSEGNIQLASSIFEEMGRKLATSRLQRDLSDSTTIRNVGVAMSYSLLAYKNTLLGLGKIQPNQSAINEALNQNWSILTEGVQTLLRREKVKDPYSLIASLVRGKRINQEEWQNWVENLPIKNKLKEKLKNLTPLTYAGYAEKLTEMTITEIKNLKIKTNII